MPTISTKAPQVRNSKQTVDLLLFFGEYIYYAILVYSLMAGAIGLRVPLLGTGLLVVLGLLCLLRLGPQAIVLIKGIAYPLGCAISFIMVQALFHVESLADPIFKAMVIWIMSLIIIHTLFLRKGFFVRFTVACFLIGLCLLPFLSSVTPGGEYERFGLEGVGLSNPNALAEWFGFCGVVFVIIGLETKFLAVRLFSWSGALVCIFVIGLTISRLSLAAFAVAVTIAFRSRLGRGIFIPLLLVCIGGWIAFESGIFDTAIKNYTMRATEETGRLSVWPRVIDRVLESPFLGVGISDKFTTVILKNKTIEPHNAFLYIALVSGIIPFGFFVAYWTRAGFGAWRAASATKKDRMTDAPFLLPLFIFAFLANFGNDTGFMYPWMMVVLTMTTLEKFSRPIPLFGRARQKQFKSKDVEKK